MVGGDGADDILRGTGDFGGVGGEAYLGGGGGGEEGEEGEEEEEGGGEVEEGEGACVGLVSASSSLSLAVVGWSHAGVCEGGEGGEGWGWG